ncbi:hypothetical protein [Clostridium botulinum]|uniref:hypothetical protein n=1 Tax=Clostridium botulinum TaxID=1491 RepID=UPI001FA6ECF2|nr:hypothetical protein [Clostridium botulinum]
MNKLGWHKEILISPKDLRKCSILEKKIIIKKTTDVLVVGKIIDQYNNPIAKAIISVKQIDNSYSPPKIQEFGYLTTNKEGEYATLLPCSYSVDYILDVYEPIVEC